MARIVWSSTWVRVYLRDTKKIQSRSVRSDLLFCCRYRYWAPDMGRMNTQNSSSTTARLTTKAVAVVRSFLVMGRAITVRRLPVTAKKGRHCQMAGKLVISAVVSRPC